MKTLRIALILLAAASLCRADWLDYPVVTTPSDSDTFLIGTATTNEQITAANVRAYASASSAPLASWQAFTNNANSLALVDYLLASSYNNAWGHLGTNTLGLYLTTAAYDAAWGNLSTNTFSLYLPSATYTTAWGNLPTNTFSLYLPSATYSAAWGNLPTNTFSLYLPSATYSAAWGAFGTNALTSLSSNNFSGKINLGQIDPAPSAGGGGGTNFYTIPLAVGPATGATNFVVYTNGSVVISGTVNVATMTATNVAYSDPTIDGKLPNAQIPYANFSTNASMTIAGIAGLTAGYQYAFSVIYSNAAAGNITVTGPPGGLYFGAVSTNAQVVPGGKSGIWSFWVLPSSFTNICNVLQQ